MGMGFKAADCPKCRGIGLAQGRGEFKCRRCGEKFRAGNKYNAVREKDHTGTWESQAEKRYVLRVLALRQKAGEVRNIRVKPRYEMEPDIFYKPEATYFDIALGTDITVDVKGSATKGGRFPTVKKIWRNHMDHPLHIVEYDGRTDRFLITQRVTPRKVAR